MAVELQNAPSKGREEEDAAMRSTEKTLVGGQSTRQSSAVSAIFAFLLTAILATFPTLVMSGCNDEAGTSVKVTRKTPQPTDNGTTSDGGKQCDVDGDGYPDDQDCNPLATVEGALKSGYNGQADCDFNWKDDAPVCGADPKAVDCKVPAMSVCAKCVNPGALEVCDGVDNDCDGQIDEAVASLCNDGDPCTTDSCDSGTGSCVHQDNTAQCDDGDACTIGETCAGGVCVAGPETDCDDGNVCTNDNCDAATGCVNTNNTNPCDDGDICTENDMCVGGVCIAGEDDLDCDDANPCTADSCNPTTGCVNEGGPMDGTLCDDGSECTALDECEAGICGGLMAICDDANPCTNDSCDPETGCVFTNNSNPCDDGDVCTVNDTCIGGVCLGNPNDCDDGEFCTTDTCDQEAQECVHSAFVCPTIGEMCSEGAQAPICSPPACQVANGDEADSSLKTEANVPEGYGFACAASFGVYLPYEDADGDEWPDGENDCADGVDGDADWFFGIYSPDCDDPDCANFPACECSVDGDCDDSNDCTSDTCQPGIGCVNETTPMNGQPCSDNNLCTTADTCAGGQCQGGPPLACDDGNLCSNDSCNPATGCVFEQIGTCPGGADQLAVITVEGRVMNFDQPPNVMTATGGFDVLPAGSTFVTISATNSTELCECFYDAVYLGACGVLNPQTRFCIATP
ncbi:MAG: putative metal-binding motif-containing protein [Candidatus Magasanikbacteria bacterium]|nr:putative metal-binding motif-containing protein [Candidatus Magasanikbacteria bacterium]